MMSRLSHEGLKIEVRWAATGRGRPAPLSNPGPLGIHLAERRLIGVFRGSEQKNRADGRVVGCPSARCAPGAA